MLAETENTPMKRMINKTFFCNFIQQKFVKIWVYQWTTDHW